MLQQPKNLPPSRIELELAITGLLVQCSAFCAILSFGSWVILKLTVKLCLMQQLIVGLN